MKKLASIKHNEVEGIRVDLNFDESKNTIISTFNHQSELVEESTEIAVKTKAEAIEAIKMMYNEFFWDLKFYEEV
jgi:hypothetical protein